MLRPEIYAKIAELKIMRSRSPPVPDVEMPGRLEQQDAQPKKPAMTLAEQIVMAGERRRTPDMPMTTDKTALAIIAAGKRRRGEIP